MAKARRSRRTWTTLIVLVLVSVSIITLDQTGGTSKITSGLKSAASTIFSPFRSGVNDVLSPVGDFFAGSVHYGALQQENANLRASLDRLRQQQLESTIESRQLKELLALQNLPFLDGLPTITAQTQGLDISNFAATINIDKGRDDGVAVGMPVVGGGGLVGQVVASYHSSAIVRLITDGQSRVGAVFGSPGTYATVTGQGSGRPLDVDYVPPGTTVTKGEPLFTNGLAGGTYPLGIPVATVTSAHTLPGAVQVTVSATPTADLQHLTYVDVVVWEPSS